MSAQAARPSWLPPQRKHHEVQRAHAIDILRGAVLIHLHTNKIGQLRMHQLHDT